MTSLEQLNRIVGMVSELTRKSRQGTDSASLDELARDFSVTKNQVQADIRTLTLLGDDPDSEWLLSLSVWQEGDRVSIGSGGQFQRPIRFTNDEVMAIQLGLAASGQAAEQVSSALAGLLAGAAPASQALAGRGTPSASTTQVVLKAIDNHRRLEIRYTGERSLGGINRVIHPYQLLEQEGHTYVVAWCEVADGWRHFRIDRILDAIPADGAYQPRDDFVPAEHSFAPPSEGTTPVEVRFSPVIARWIKERHPEARSAGDGTIVVTYLVASPEWLVRHVLQYGGEAEVTAPESFRELMRAQLAAK